MRKYLADCREGARILASREFWREFRAFYSSDAIKARIERTTKYLQRGGVLGPRR